MIISVDHGNKSIKTPNALFTSGLIVSEGLQGFKTDYICWNNKYYTLTEQRIAYLRDKTEDERFYVLTLFAIAKELERRKVPETLDPIDITLLVGLPPAHYAGGAGRTGWHRAGLRADRDPEKQNSAAAHGAEYTAAEG